MLGIIFCVQENLYFVKMFLFDNDEISKSKQQYIF